MENSLINQKFPIKEHLKFHFMKATIFLASTTYEVFHLHYLIWSSPQLAREVVLAPFYRADN